MVAPTTSWPSSTRRAAATELSTPPDIATRTRLRTSQHHRQLADLLDHPGEHLDGALDVLGGRVVAEAQPDRAERERARHPRRGGHGGGSARAGGARGPARRGDPRQVEMHEERLAVGAGDADSEALLMH